MAASIPDAPRRRNAGLLLCCALAVAAGPAGSAAAASQDPINLEAASSDFDYRNNTLLFRRVRITQGALQVEAQEASATGLNFDNSVWSLKGAVRIMVTDGKLASSDARVTFRNNQIVSALIRGTPASFEAVPFDRASSTASPRAARKGPRAFPAFLPSSLRLGT